MFDIPDEIFQMDRRTKAYKNFWKAYNDFYDEQAAQENWYYKQDHHAHVDAWIRDYAEHDD